MTFRSWLRAFERDALRPLGRRLRWLGARGRTADRIQELEHRVDALESLVRELTGLAWLRLDDQSAPGSGGLEPRPSAREAA